MDTDQLLKRYVELILGPAGLDELDVPGLVLVVSEDTADPMAEAAAVRIRSGGGFARVIRPGQPHGFDRLPVGALRVFSS